MRRRLLAAVVLAAVLVAGLASAAAAHSVLVASAPSGGATVETAPSEIRLTFSERIEASFGGVQVFDAAENRIETGAAVIDGEVVAVPLPALPAPGDYTVVYRVISGDGHPVESRFAFTYAPAAAPSPPPEPSPSPEVAVPPPPSPQASPAPSPDATPSPSPSPSPEASDGAAAASGSRAGDGGAAQPVDVELEDAGPGSSVGLWLARFVDYAALTAVVGLLLVGLVLLPGPDRLADRRRAAVRGAAVASAVWALAALGIFTFGLSVASARALPQALSGDIPARFAATRLGWSSLAQAAVAVLAAAAALRARSRRAGFVALGLAAVGAFAPGWWGHAGTAAAPPLSLASNWLHVLAATAWVGGLLGLVVVAARLGDDLAVPASRFSTIATWALGAVLLTGLVNAATRVSQPAQLVETDYGRMVLAKLALFAAIAGLGFLTRTRLLPALRRQGTADAARRAFLRLARAEAVLMIAAIGVATGLASSIPADAEAAAGIQSINRPFGDGQLTLTVDPAQTGANLVHLYVLDAGGQLRDDAADAALTFGLGGTEVQASLTPTGPGHWTALGVPIEQPGTYEVRVAAEVGGEAVETSAPVTFR